MSSTAPEKDCTPYEGRPELNVPKEKVMKKVAYGLNESDREE